MLLAKISSLKKNWNCKFNFRVSELFFYLHVHSLKLCLHIVSFKKLEKDGSLPSEEEIDKQLDEYFNTAEINEFEFDNLQSYSEVLKHGDSYSRELNLADKFLK